MTHPTTTAVRTAQYQDLSDAHGEPIAMTSAYVFRSAAEAAARFSGEKPGNVYSRFTNPTVQAFEQRLAALEGADEAVAFASGMAAIAAVAHAWLASGTNVVCARDLFGTTTHALRHYFGRFGVGVRAVPLTDLGAWDAAMDADTRLVFIETPSHPLQQVGDIQRLAQLAHARGALLVVDNTLLTPLGQRPLSVGADLVLHSAGKLIDGQGRCLAGVVAGRSELMAELRRVVRCLGASLSPMNAWLLLKGLETLGLRLAAAQSSALALAHWLRGRPGVGAVHCVGFADHPQHALIQRQQRGMGAVLSFEVGDTREQAWAFIDALSLVSIATHIGDTRSMVTHPATTTHGRLSAQERQAMGINEALVRLSVGLEDLDDLRDDLACALQRSQRPLPQRTRAVAADAP